MIEYKEKPSSTIKKFLGVSTSVKPTDNASTYDTFLELDTKKMFIYSEQNINPLTSDGWWEV